MNATLSGIGEGFRLNSVYVATIFFAELRDEPKEEAADIDELERQLYARVQQVTAWIGFMQSTMNLVEQLLEMAEPTSAFMQDDSRTTQDFIPSLRAGREEINQTSKLVDEVKAGLVEIHARPVDRRGGHATGHRNPGLLGKRCQVPLWLSR